MRGAFSWKGCFRLRRRLTRRKFLCDVRRLREPCHIALVLFRKIDSRSCAFAMRAVVVLAVTLLLCTSGTIVVGQKENEKLVETEELKSKLASDPSLMKAAIDADVSVRHNRTGAPNGIESWKTPVDYLIDGHPKAPASTGGKIIDDTRKDWFPVDNKGMKTMWGGVRVILDRPVHVVSELDLRRIGVAVNEAAARNNFILDQTTACFCRMITKVRCACTSGAAEAARKFKLHGAKQSEQIAGVESGKSGTIGQKMDVIEMRARAEHMEQTRQTHASHVHSVQARESNRTRLLAKRLGEHRKAAEGKREDRLAAELTALPRVAADKDDWGHRGADGESPVPIVNGPHWTNGSMVHVKVHPVVLGSCLKPMSPCKWSIFHAVTMSRPAVDGPRYADLQSAKEACETYVNETCLAIVRNELEAENSGTDPAIVAHETAAVRERRKRPYLLRLSPSQLPREAVQVDEKVWASMFTRECPARTFGPGKEGLARVVAISPDGYVDVLYANDGVLECRLSPQMIHAPSAGDSIGEMKKAEKVSEESTKEHIRLIQEINMKNAESKLMVQAIKLMRNETVARAKEYFAIEKETVRNNEEVNKVLREERRKRHAANLKEVQAIDVKGWSDLKHAVVKSKDELIVLKDKASEALKLQKQEADKEVFKSHWNVSNVRKELRRLQLIPITMVEEQDKHFLHLRDLRDAVKSEYTTNEAAMKEEEKKRLDAIARARQEELVKRNETDSLETDLQKQLKVVEDEMNARRKKRIQKAEENEKRRVLPPLPPLHPVLPKCGPTPGWLLGKDQQSREIGRCLMPTRNTDVYPFLREIFRDGSIASGCAAMGRNISYLQVLHRLSGKRGNGGPFASDLNAQRKDSMQPTGARGNRAPFAKNFLSLVQSGESSTLLRGGRRSLLQLKPKQAEKVTVQDLKFTLLRGGQNGDCKANHENCFKADDRIFVRVNCRDKDPRLPAQWVSSTQNTSSSGKIWNQEVTLKLTADQSQCWMHVHRCADDRRCEPDIVSKDYFDLLGTFPIQRATSAEEKVHVENNCGVKSKHGDGAGCGWIWYSTDLGKEVSTTVNPFKFILRRGGQKGACSEDYDNCFMKGDDLFVRVSCESSDPNQVAQWASTVKKNQDSPVWNEEVELNATGKVCWMFVHECDKSEDGKWCSGDVKVNKNTELLGTFEIPTTVSKVNDAHIYQNCGKKQHEGSGCGWIWYETKAVNEESVEPKPVDFILKRGGQKGQCNSKYDNCFMKGDDLFARVSCESSDPNMQAQWVSSVKKNQVAPEWNEQVRLNATGSVCWMHMHECDRSMGGKWCNGDLVPNKNSEYLGTYEIPVQTSANEIHINTNCGNKKKEGSGCGWIWFDTKIPFEPSVVIKQLNFELQGGGSKPGIPCKNYDNCFMKGDDIFVRLSCESEDPNSPAQWVSSTSRNTDQPAWNQGAKLNATGDKCWMHVHQCPKGPDAKWCMGDLLANPETKYLGTYDIPIVDSTNGAVHVIKNCGNGKPGSAGCGWIFYNTFAGPLDTTKSWQCMGQTNVGSVYFGQHLLVPKGKKNAKMLCEALTCMCQVDPSHESGSCSDRLQAADSQNNNMWKSVMREKLHQLEHAYAGDVENGVVPANGGGSTGSNVFKLTLKNGGGKGACNTKTYENCFMKGDDVFVRVSCQSSDPQHEAQWASSVKKNTDTPVWNEEVELKTNGPWCWMHVHECDKGPDGKWCNGDLTANKNSELLGTFKIPATVSKENEVHINENCGYKVHEGSGCGFIWFDTKIISLRQSSATACTGPRCAKIDVPGLYHRLEAQKKELARATGTLTSELQARWGKGPSMNQKLSYNMLGDGGKTGTFAHPGGGSEAVIYKYIEQMRILNDEIDKLRKDLKQCKAKPNMFVPGCAEDLTFQIARLQDEVDSRVAYMAQKRVEAEEQKKALQKELQQCHSPSGGCPVQKEQELLLTLKTLSTEIDIRQRAQTDIDWRRIYGCLWKYRSMGQAKAVEQWFTKPHVDISRGCARLKEVPALKVLDQCLCSEDKEVQGILKNAKLHAAQNLAREKLAAATQEYNEKKNAKAREQEKETAKQVAQNIVYNNLQKEGSLDQALREAARERKTNPAVAGAVAQAVNSGKAALKSTIAQIADDGKSSGCDKGVDCKESAGGYGVDMQKLENCLARSNSEVVKANLRKAFTTGNLKTGCALLSLASNSILRDIHGCMCSSSGGEDSRKKGGSGPKDESMRMANAAAMGGGGDDGNTGGGAGGVKGLQDAK